MHRFTLFVLGIALMVTPLAWGQDEGQVYLIKSVGTGKVWAPDMDGKGLVQHSERANVKFQHWKLVKGKEANTFQIVNVGNGKVLSAPAKEAEVQMVFEASAAKHKPSQWFVFEKMPKGFIIKSQSSGLYLDVHRFSQENGATITQFELSDAGKRGNQLWELVPAK